MSHQNPLANLRRREPRQRRAFPDETYQEQVLGPMDERAEDLLADAARDVFRAHAITLGEQRIVEPEQVAAVLRAIDQPGEDVAALPRHPLAQLEARIVAASSADALLGRSREEAALAAMRLVLRARMLALAEAVIELRETIATLASSHLTTLILATSNGQVVQPTTLGHYLAGQLGPLARASERLREAFGRLNRSPLGAVSGMSTAMPIRRERSANLLGFDGMVENTFDAIAAGDVVSELVSIVGVAAVELQRLVADLSQWARDDVGTLTPGDEYVHSSDTQPQRRDPLVLDHLRVRLASLAATPQHLTLLLGGRQMLGGEATRYEAFFLAEWQLSDANQALQLLASVLRSAEVNRSLFANRTHRGFPTSSELADLLSVDFRIPRTEAAALAERIVVEATEMGGEATTLRTELIDRIALRERGVEVGIEPEMLAKCLSPKRFVERRDVIGGPAPSAVNDSLEREALALRRERSWVRERQEAIDTARAALGGRAQEIVRDPQSVLQRARPTEQPRESQTSDDKI